LADFAVDVGGALETDTIGDNGALGLAANEDISGLDPAFDKGAGVDDQSLALDVADDLALDQNIAVALEIAPHGQAPIDDRLGRLALGVAIHIGRRRRRRVVGGCRRIIRLAGIEHRFTFSDAQRTKGQRRGSESKIWARFVEMVQRSTQCSPLLILRRGSSWASWSVNSAG
jgi:hypothetical protein